MLQKPENTPDLTSNSSNVRILPLVGLALGAASAGIAVACNGSGLWDCYENCFTESNEFETNCKAMKVFTDKRCEEMAWDEFTNCLSCCDSKYTC